MPTSALDTPALRDACRDSADADAARHALARVLDAHPDLADELVAGGVLLDALVAVGVASFSLLEAVVADVELLEPLRDKAELAGERTQAGLDGAAATASRVDGDPARGLRRLRHREILRVAARDLLGLSDLRTVGRELAALAQACLGAALEAAGPRIPFTVVGMGKLGGRELNYASDVDVLFVHDGETSEADRVAKEMLRLMSARTPDGVVFRTDADLRPEGRAGALSRSVEGYVEHWDRWAQAWEFQALLKARPVAGNADLGAAFVTRAEPRVWPDVLDPDALREIRAMKERSETLLRRRGVQDQEVKRGPGGIRDIEFAIQILQLVHGRHDRSVRTATTLDALERLAAAGYITVRDAAALDDAYVWLRTVEHRLQLVNEQQTHSLPTDEVAHTRLARVLGFRDRGELSAGEQFDSEHRRRVATVRRLHEEIFFAPLLETLAGTGHLPGEKVEERLAAFGFGDVDQTRAALHELTAGLTRRSRVMQQLLPAILGWLSESPDPDLGLLQLRRMTEGYTRSRAVAQSFRDSPVAAERACRLLGSSRVLGLALYRQPEFVDALGDEALLTEEPDRAALVEEALDTLDWRVDDEGRMVGLRRFKRRHLLRIGARDLLGTADVESTGRELSNLADAALEAALRSLEPDVPFTVIGMGRLGGRELSYASDIDVLFVHRGEGATGAAVADRTAMRLMRAIGATTAEGQTFRIDADLRPEGKAGVLARSLDGYRDYYERWVMTWELQALLRARPAAGDAALARHFCALVEPYVYREPFPLDDVREVRRMKARVEKERPPAGADARFDMKLGRGSLSDVEFTVQLLQLEHGATHPEVRSPSTIGGLHALVRAGLLADDDGEILEQAYRLCERARNRRYLLTGLTGDQLPRDEEGERVALMLGYLRHPRTSLLDDYRRATRRARRVVERVFYGEEDDHTV